MIKSSVLIIHSYNDTRRISKLIDKLGELGIHVKTQGVTLELGDLWTDMATSSISNAKNIVFFIDKTTVESEESKNRMFFALEYAIKRDKQIIPIVEWSSHTLEGEHKFDFLLSRYQIIFPENGLHSQQDYIDVAGKIYDLVTVVENKELLYDKIASLSKIQYTPGISSNLCELILLLCSEIKKEPNILSRRKTYKEILRMMEKLQQCGESGYTPDDKKQARKRLEVLIRIEDDILKHNDFLKLDLFFISFVLKANYLDYNIRTDVIDTITYGDVHGVGVEALRDKYLARQTLYTKMYNIQIVSENITDNNHGNYDDEEMSLILTIKEFVIYDKPSSDIATKKHSIECESNDKERQLYAIADYIKQSNKLFELLSNQSSASDFLKCLKTSYERLRKYSEIIGCIEICAESIERIAEINQQLEMIGESISDSNIVESGIKALLGFSLPGMDDFDVFLSYKHEDMDIAKNVYHHLKSKIINPFFDTITLPELSKSEYEDAIMNAIEHSRHFVVIISNLEYLNSYWVELEMKTFRHEMVEGRKKDANFIMLVSDNVFQEILSTNKQCLPIKYRSYEIMRLSEYKNSLTKYLK